MWRSGIRGLLVFGFMGLDCDDIGVELYDCGVGFFRGPHHSIPTFRIAKAMISAGL